MAVDVLNRWRNLGNTRRLSNLIFLLVRKGLGREARGVHDRAYRRPSALAAGK